MSSDEGGLRRWARRKAEVKRRRGGAAPVLEKDQAEKPTVSEPRELATAGEGATELTPENLDLPDIESLTAESDFSAFMKEGVPPALRRLALRKLWSSDPMFNVIDEMVEYGEDYTNAAMVVEGMKSAWAPGRGYARDESEPEEKRADDAGATGHDQTPKGAADGAEKTDSDDEKEISVEVEGEEPDEDAELG